MVKRVAAFAGLLLGAASCGAHALECDDLWAYLNKGCALMVDTYQRGDNELVFSGYGYHLRSTYTESKLHELNERNWGAGWARTVTDPDGDTHSVFALAFYDSNRHVEYQAGYVYQTYWGAQNSLQGGLGYAAFILERPDIADGYPIPAALPMTSLRYDRLTVMATFIPTFHGVNNGSTLYFFGRYDFR